MARTDTRPTYYAVACRPKGDTAPMTTVDETCVSRREALGTALVWASDRNLDLSGIEYEITVSARRHPMHDPR